MTIKSDTYEIRILKKVQKNLLKLPKNIRQRFVALAEQLRDRGPVAHDWPNYSKLSENSYYLTSSILSRELAQSLGH